MAYGFGGKGDNSRALFRAEIALIKQVFRTARLPSLAAVGNGPSVTIADGVNGNGGAWTDSDYQINVGKYLYERDLSAAAPSTLVHEMTHVWQYYNGTLSKSHAFGAQARAWAADKVYDVLSKKKPAQSAVDALYAYDLAGSWNDMGFEGQAQMVEDWYDMGMKDEGYRYVFMKHVVWSGKPGNRSKTRVELTTTEFDVSEPAPVRATVNEERVPLTDSFLIGLLQPRYAVNDVSGYGARARQVERVFQSTNMTEARPLTIRLAHRKPGDKVSMYFYDHLSTPTRTKLLQILQNRAAGK
jgi:hypothetical protein